MLAISGGDKMSSLLGSQSAIAFPVSLVLGTAAFGGLLAACRHWRTTPVGQLRVLLVGWYLLPLAALTVLPTVQYIHYFIILLPLPFLGLAYALDKLTERRAALGWLVLAVCLCSFIALDAEFFRTIVDDGGAPGDYGVAYRYTAEATAMFVRENPGSAFEIRTYDNSNPYVFLVWNSRPNDPAPTGPAVIDYVLINTLYDIPPRLRRLRNAWASSRKTIGPLEIVSIPLKR
jgi:hypothetical protein